MNISFITIKNFRKLKDVRINFSNETTLFVGANNSGKTSAMDVLRKFLVKGDGNGFIFNDFTVSNRSTINRIGEAWVISDAQKPGFLRLFAAQKAAKNAPGFFKKIAGTIVTGRYMLMWLK
jgi:predicted ATP-dependent endonuclease of OLD family